MSAYAVIRMTGVVGLAGAHALEHVVAAGVVGQVDVAEHHVVARELRRARDGARRCRARRRGSPRSAARARGGPPACRRPRRGGCVVPGPSPAPAPSWRGRGAALGLLPMLAHPSTAPFPRRRPVATRCETLCPMRCPSYRPLLRHDPPEPSLSARFTPLLSQPMPSPAELRTEGANGDHERARREWLRAARPDVALERGHRDR